MLLHEPQQFLICDVIYPQPRPNKNCSELVAVFKFRFQSLFTESHLTVLQSVSVPEFDGRGLSAVRKFDSNQLPANTPNEDRRSTATCLQV